VEKQTVHLNIRGRKVPLRVSPNEVATVQAAAQRINLRIDEFMQQFSLQDETLMAYMCCLEFATEMQRQRESTTDEREVLIDAIEQLHHEVDKLLEAVPTEA
jgi:cell division protein ZapA (FtsZ GTPase activity inhibitor)